MDGVPCLCVSQCYAQRCREYLRSQCMLDQRFTFQKGNDGTVALPILSSCWTQPDLQTLTKLMASDGICEIRWTQTLLQSKHVKGRMRGDKLVRFIQELLESHEEDWTEELRHDLPHSYQCHGDLVLLADHCFSLPVWKKIGQDLWPVVAKGLGAKRLAMMSRVSRDGFRTPSVTVLLGDHSWVTHVDNGIRYNFDVTKSMFSAGNITEKLRVAAFDCEGETVVDLYAGIGYFTLPYLVHAGASHVHACEWNPDAVTALRRNLLENNVDDRCTIHHRDNRTLCNLADRVNLGLIPSSEEGWPIACRLLRRTTGGILHIHHNITSPSQGSPVDTSHLHAVSQGPAAKRGDREVWQAWADDTACCIARMLKDSSGRSWRSSVRHIEHVKSYAPRIHHIVLDLECRPLNSAQSLN
ncbi:tRNA wybutosine-synthesizing protein 2 [Merluccius polli]|uniref:tRNA wybutosine-synthesizing protein 2 homolog n=1 Tax=Merluccius polli TaxID=89951 RepID=A0AA47P350_MERPO|nr:tRNA wybutosine-synthesizing protein 2 [Merluccius polli]